ncbi:MAG: M23 family metallopeptidase, partial [Chitinophagaceae bacterium]
LAERGLRQLEIKNAGGPVEDLELEDTDEAAAFYVNEMNQIKEVLQNTPIGLPHFGEQTSGFGFRHNPFGTGAIEGHKGLDFRGDYGETIKSTADGVVEFAGVKGGYGNCVIVKHKNNFHTLYGHLSKISVKENQKIASGEKIGELGSSGRSTGPHLHYEVHVNGERVDPSRFVKQ